MRMFRLVCDHTRKHKRHNDLIHGRVRVTSIKKENCRKSFEEGWTFSRNAITCTSTKRSSNNFTSFKKGGRS